MANPTGSEAFPASEPEFGTVAVVARGNYSRSGIVRVRFNAGGDPVAVERLGIALEPTAPYELRADGGGCEDPRITFVEPLKRYVMTYTAFSHRIRSRQRRVESRSHS